jgi:DNA polymerase I-like protein with 3'-5' exonuclease and polymerase domains
MTNIRFIRETSELEKVMPSLFRTEVAGFDTETSGLDPHYDKVVMVQIGTPNAQLVIDARSCSMEPLRPWLESREHKKILHNALFDYKFMRGSFGISIEHTRDSFLGEQLLTNGLQFRGFGLKDVAKKYLDVDLSKDVRGTFGSKACLTGDFSQDQIDYGARDVSYLIPIIQAQSNRIGDMGLAETFVLECEFTQALGDLEFDGLYLDQDSWKNIINANTKRALEVEKELDGLAKLVLPCNMFGEVCINWGSPDQVLKVLKKFNVTVPVWNRGQRRFIETLVHSTDDKTLKKVKDFPIVKLLKEHRSLMMRISTFGQSYIDAIHPATGRLHPSYAQLGTATGRLAKGRDSAVNFLNIPRQKEMRNAFRGEANEFVETDDYSGCELRIWAAISGDPNLCEAFERGEDIHCSVGSKLFGKTVTKNDPLRTPAKTLNFGIVYGMGVSAVYDQINGVGYPITQNQTQQLYEKYVQEYKVGINFLRDVGKQAIKTGFVSNINGRRRNWIIPDHTDREKFPGGKRDMKYTGIISKIEREAGNFPIQSVNADMCKRAMINMRPLMKEHRSKFILQVYDEICTRTHEDSSEAFHPIKQKIMVDSAEQYLKTVPMVVDGHRLRTWTK